MFEHTLLIAPRDGRKSGTLFASLLAQIFACGVLLLVPLLYTDVLPSFRGLDTLPPVYVAGPLPPPPEREVIARPQARTFNPFEVPRITAPRVAPTAPIMTGRQFDITAVPSIAAPAGPFNSPALTELPGLAGPPPAAPRATEVAKPPEPDPPAGPVPVSSGVQAAKLIKQVLPVYPRIASQARIDGVVKLLAIIGTDGTIRKVDVMEGHPLLRQAALDAVRQWVYSPTYLSGKAVEVEAPIEVRFQLRY
jgi:protein TonB